MWFRIKMSRQFAEKHGMAGCVFVSSFILAVNAVVGGVAFQYVLWYTLNKDIPWIADGLIGLVAGQMMVPAAIVCWILSVCGVGPFN